MSLVCKCMREDCDNPHIDESSHSMTVERDYATGMLYVIGNIPRELHISRELLNSGAEGIILSPQGLSILGYVYRWIDGAPEAGYRRYELVT